MSEWGEYEEDAAREAYDSKVSEEAIYAFKKEFRYDKLQSYYKQNPTVAKEPIDALAEAHKLHAASYHSAAVVLSIAASEAFLKNVVLKGIISGAIHLDAFTEHIVSLALKPTGIVIFKDTLKLMFREIFQIEFTQHQLPNHKRPLWECFHEVQKVRNDICHQAANGSAAQAALAIAVATELIEGLFPKVLQELSMHLHVDAVLCGDYQCTHKKPIQAFGGLWHT